MKAYDELLFILTRITDRFQSKLELLRRASRSGVDLLTFVEKNGDSNHSTP